MATTKTNTTSFTGNVLRDGYTLLQTFVNGGTAQAAENASVTPTTLATRSGVMSLGAGDGVRLIFYATSSLVATQGTFRLLLYEPVFNSSGAVSAYIETSANASPTTMSISATITAGAALNSVISGVPTAARAIDTLASGGTGQQTSVATTGTVDGDYGDLFVFSPGAGGVAFADFRPARGVAYVRVIMTCATAATTVYCLARRLQGESQSLRTS